MWYWTEFIKVIHSLRVQFRQGNMIRKSFAGIGVLLFTFYIAATVSAPATTHTYFPADTIPSRFGFGAPASEARIAVWDIDVRPDGKGLPEGTGSVLRGKE